MMEGQREDRSHPLRWRLPHENNKTPYVFSTEPNTILTVHLWGGSVVVYKGFRSHFCTEPLILYKANSFFDNGFKICIVSWSNSDIF